MISLLRGVLIVIAFAAFAFLTGYFSFWPRYEYASPGTAVVKVSLSHATHRVKPCVRLTPAEMAELAPNMRTTERCERERVPLAFELEADGEVVLSLRAAPSGLWGDGPASIYERFNIAPGNHRFTARLRDSARDTGWDHESSDTVMLQQGRYFVITFHAENGGFRFQ